MALLMQALALPAHADAPTPIPMQQLMELARGGAAALPADARIEIEPGQLDPRLKLTPCRRIEPYLPTGSTAWGRTRVGLRCTDGPVNWNVFLPVTVRVWSPAVVNAGPLQAGAEIRAEDLQIREVDIASAAAPVFRDPQLLVGRLLAATLPPGTPLRPHHLRVRQWFAAGETVTLVYVGEGFSASTEAQALSNGLDGQAVRVRTPSGKIVTGRPVGERRVEVRS
ncbi:flagellar basal body P-ring formation chaperone FlgA [Sphaerotilus sulfidivorans]|uniref:flagellar basal body P-ring formation chaperone FlgA n=1 Tax=Sphaerotilus sp. FB-3 TaxID=2913396 RepID=UPI00203C6121|nr:flagellar basal body P-ring formation chaperone FlgA [Sphaerotilus sp. FB-3]